MSKSAVRKKGKSKRFSYIDVLKDLFPWKGDSLSEKIRKIIFLIAVIVFGVCAFFVFNYFYENYKNDKMYEEIQVNIPNLAELIENDIENTVSDGEMLDYMKKLIERNSDIVGHIQIPDKSGSCEDSMVNYPVVQKKDAEEREFYLEHNIDKEKARAGSIFMDWRNEFGMGEQSDNLIIYGHQMQGGSMFGSLSNYEEYYSFYGEHPCIELSSRYEVSTYKIFAVFYAYGGSDSNDFYPYNTIDFGSEEEFYEYVNQIKRRTLILNDVDVKYNDQLLLLSTCATGYFDEARFIVAARKLRHGEDKYSGTENSSRNPNILYPPQWYEANGEGMTYDSNAEFIPYG